MCNPYKVLGFMMMMFALGGFFAWRLNVPVRPRRRKLRVLKGGRKK